MKSLQKTALVTGGARRIGRAIVERLHQQGFNVSIHCNSSQHEAQRLAAKLNQKRPDSAIVVVGNLLEPDCAATIIAQTLEPFNSLDLLVNNASTFYPTAIDSVTQSDWTDLMGSNLKAPLFMAKEAASTLRSAAGCIVNIIDIYAQRPLLNHSVYCAAKAGLEMLTKSLARELAPTVRVNGVAPGAILWPENEDHPLDAEELLNQIPLARLGEANDIAQAVLFFATQAPYVTGQILAVDGGRSVVI